MVTITDCLGWTGALVSICFFASPFLNFIKLLKKKISYKDINILIIFGNYISSIVWLIYGYKISLKQITVCYSLGALISLIWIWIYLTFLGKKKMTQALIFTMILSFLTFALYIILTVVISDIKTLGEVCFIVCSLSYISPTQLLIKVLNNKDIKIIPLYSAIISGIGYFSWTFFGLFKFNANIIIPNLVGLAFSLAQIILYRIYKNKKALTEEIGSISHSVIGAMKNVVEKTVEIANSINPNNIENKKEITPNVVENINNMDNQNNNVDINFNTNNNVNDKKEDIFIFDTNPEGNEPPAVDKNQSENKMDIKNT